MFSFCYFVVEGTVLTAVDCCNSSQLAAVAFVPLPWGAEPLKLYLAPFMSCRPDERSIIDINPSNQPFNTSIPTALCMYRSSRALERCSSTAH